MEKSLKAWSLITIISAVLLLNIIGVVIELLFSIGVLETDLVNIRKINPASLVLSVGFIVSGFAFIANYYKNKINTLKLWNIFMTVSILMVAYKSINPTYLSVLIPYYFVVMFVIIFAVWLLVFIHVKKQLRRK